MVNQITKETFAVVGTKMEKLLFPVELGEVFVKTKKQEDISADYFKAVVAYKSKQNPEVFSVVTDNYRLVTNREAIEIGKDIFRELFGKVNPDEILPYRIIYPKTMSYCHIQLVHKKVNFEVWEQETWLPFIQLSNSYNRTFALTYELGFVRELCNNGVIFRKKTIKLKSMHNKSDKLQWKLNIGIQELKNLQMEFIAYMKNLKRYYINPKYIVPLACKVLGFHFNIEKQDDTLFETGSMGNKQLQELREVIDRLAPHYFNEMGHNAYAAFNIITHLISNENEKISKFSNFSLHSTSYYYKPTEWLHDFMEKIQRTDFDMEEYLSDFIQYAA